LNIEQFFTENSFKLKTKKLQREILGMPLGIVGMPSMSRIY
jgi:hypothetical protein